MDPRERGEGIGVDARGEDPERLQSAPAPVGAGEGRVRVGTAMDADYLPFHPNPSKPRYTPPPGAVDAHCHVFGPAARFPYAQERKYTPCDAPRERLYALRDFLGFERNVVVQATCHGNDNRALVDALIHSHGRARGVASVGRGVTDAELDALHDAGVRGVRFNFVRRLVDFTPRDVLAEIAARIAPRGWHVVVYFEAQDLPELWDFFTSLPTTVVVDHMGRPDVGQPVDGPGFGLFRRLLAEHRNVWSKVSCPERLSKSGPPGYDDVVPFARRIVEEFPDRVLWGTDWPHPNMKSHMPDDGALVDVIPRIAPTPSLERRLLVDNPMRLYWPEVAAARAYTEAFADIPGTVVFDATQSRLGYGLNQFCMSLMNGENRAAFKADERGYLAGWPMTGEQREAVIARDYNRMLALGGNIYFIAKIGATDGHSFQNLAAKMTGVPEDAYRAMMIAGGRPARGNRSRSDPSR